MELQLKQWCVAMTAHSVQAELLWHIRKIILIGMLLLGRAPMIFQMTWSSFGFLPHSCSIPWRQSSSTERFDLLPVTASVEIIPFLTVPRWAGLPWQGALSLAPLPISQHIPLNGFSFFYLPTFIFGVCLLVQAEFYLYGKHEWAIPPLAQLEILFISNSALLPLHGAEIKLVPTVSLCSTGRDRGSRKAENTWAIIEPEIIFKEIFCSARNVFT